MFCYRFMFDDKREFLYYDEVFTDYRSLTDKWLKLEYDGRVKYISVDHIVDITVVKIEYIPGRDD